MNKEFWNQRYRENETVYGTRPNSFFKEFIDKHKPGSLLLPAEGEGRNAIYAAQKGWQVDAFDFSEVARDKALQNAKQSKVSINYSVASLTDFHTDKQYDAVALIFVHLPENERKHFHQEVARLLKSGGYLLLSAFTKEQINFTSGGPKELSLLYDAPSICSDFPFMHILYCGEKEVDLDEGDFHKGKAHVLQLLSQKL